MLNAKRPVATAARHSIGHYVFSLITGALKDAASALRSEPVDVVRLDRASTLLQTLKQQDVLDLLSQLNEELDLAQRVLGDEFGQKLRDAIASTKNFKGITGTITLDEQRNAKKPAVILAVKNGKFNYQETVAP